MRWLGLLGGSRRRRSPFNNLDARGGLTCGQVTPQLWIGGELGPRDWDALQEQGVSVVVNLQHEQQDIFSPREKIEGYLWLPAPDGMAPSLEQLMQGVTFIRTCAESGQKVFVHCKAGQGRAPLLCACYLIAEGLAPLEAIKHVREARPRTLLTPDQSARLREFAHFFEQRSQRNAPPDSTHTNTPHTEPSTTDSPPAQSTLDAETGDGLSNNAAFSGSAANGAAPNDTPSGPNGNAIAGSATAPIHTPT
ncbi:MAG: hypothetical protein JWN98_1532 [Abditibacteriota bacterium]|jgi:protein-tyrosine phosphatase|nr:hypothetical protein [Abditibacteriota bacterium]